MGVLRWLVRSMEALLRMSPDRSAGRALLGALGTMLAIACFVLLLEETMNRTGFFNQGQTIWWPTNGLALALMIRNDRRRWPAIVAGALLGSLVGSVYHGYPMSMNAVEMVANSAGPLLGAAMLPRCREMREWLQEPHLVLKFIAFPMILAPVVSASFFAFCFQFLEAGFHFWPSLGRRAVSDMLGYAMFTPLVLVLSMRESYRLPSKRTLLVNTLLLALVIGATMTVFFQSRYPLIFILASVTVLAGLRLSFMGSVIGINMLAAIATTATMHGGGPLTLGGGAQMEQRVLLLQSFLALSMVTVFSVAVIQIGREVAQTKLNLAYLEMEKLATVDPLTGLANRRLFEETIHAEWTRACRSGDSLAVLMIDADKFKAYNDCFGHLAGDDCLREIAHAVTNIRHRSTDLFARFGGEEFVVLLPMTNIGAAAEFAAMVRSTVEGLYGQKLRCPLPGKITVSIGCAAMIPDAESAPAILIGEADMALYRAKENGRNRVEASSLQTIVPNPNRTFHSEDDSSQVESFKASLR